MSLLEDIKFQYYSGNIYSNEPKGMLSLGAFIETHRSPKVSTVSVIEMIREANAKGDIKLKKSLKEKGLFFVTPAVVVEGTRKYEDILEFTGVAQIDFDGIDNAYELKDYLFKSYREFFCVYVSPSGGVKGLIRIPICKDVAQFQDYYRALEEEFETLDGFDPAPKNAVLPLFISYDYFILSRDNPKVWTKKKKEETSYHKMYPLPPMPYQAGNSKQKKRAINTIKKMINSIVNNGHPQLRSACLILGTRVGAGYIDYSDASAEIEYLIKSNHYLSKGVTGYLTTAQWALKQGVKTPKYYE